MQPGLHFKLPLGIDVATIVPVIRQLNQEFRFATPGATDPFQAPRDGKRETEMVTGDLNAALVEWVVQYRIADPVKFLFELWGYDSTIKVSFFVEAAALKRLRSEITGAETEYLKAFDVARDRIHEIADKVYVRGARAAYSYVLVAEDFLVRRLQIEIGRGITRGLQTRSWHPLRGIRRSACSAIRRTKRSGLPSR